MAAGASMKLLTDVSTPLLPQQPLDCKNTVLHDHL
jgi:hypothetical protein